MVSDGYETMAEISEKKLGLISTFLQKSSSGCLIPSIDENGGGVHVLSKRQLKQGEELISSYAAAIALDPHYRNLCAYCANPCKDSTSASRCKDCFLLSICKNCESKGAKKWHKISGECKALCSLVHALHKVSGNDEGNGLTMNVKMTDEVDSSYVLTIRLMIRRWSEKKLPSPFPLVEWSILDELYRADRGSMDRSEHRDVSAIHELCRLIKESFCLKAEGQSESLDGSWMNEKDLDDVWWKVVGCGHAVTDVTLPLGCQSIGRALFLEHSFYNHCCTPNSFLSCRIGTSMYNGDNSAKEHMCALNARVHCIQDIQKGDHVTISYIATSGLSYSERQQRLNESYDFICNCRGCERKSLSSKAIDECIRLPVDCDVEMIRQMQFSCNQQLLQIANMCAQLKTSNIENNDELQMHELESCIATINMNKRGIRNQGIPKHHEVSIESHRLLAKALSLSGKIESSLKEHASFRDAVQPIISLFDSVALAITLVDFGRDLQRAGKSSESLSVLEDARQYATFALGGDHKMVHIINDKIRETVLRETKRQKIEDS